MKEWVSLVCLTKWVLSSMGCYPQLYPDAFNLMFLSAVSERAVCVPTAGRVNTQMQSLLLEWQPPKGLFTLASYSWLPEWLPLAKRFSGQLFIHVFMRHQLNSKISSLRERSTEGAAKWEYLLWEVFIRVRPIGSVLVSEELFWRKIYYDNDVIITHIGLPYFWEFPRGFSAN